MQGTINVISWNDMYEAFEWAEILHGDRFDNLFHSTRVDETHPDILSVDKMMVLHDGVDVFKKSFSVLWG